MHNELYAEQGERLEFFFFFFFSMQRQLDKHDNMTQSKCGIRMADDAVTLCLSKKDEASELVKHSNQQIFVTDAKTRFCMQWQLVVGRYEACK